MSRQIQEVGRSGQLPREKRDPPLSDGSLSLVWYGLLMLSDRSGILRHLDRDMAASQDSSGGDQGGESVTRLDA